MKTKFFILLAAMLLGITSAFAQNENNELLLGDVNGDGVVDGADITAVIKIMKDGGGVATANSNYATKEDLAEILEYLTCLVTKAEAANYITKDVFGQFVDQLTVQMTNLTNENADLNDSLNKLWQEMYNRSQYDSETITNLRDRIGKNEADIAWLKELYNTLSGKVDNCITVEEFDSWKTQIETVITNLMTEIANLKDNDKALQCDNANIKDRVEMNTADINFLKIIIDNQNSQIAELQTIIEELRNK